MSEQYCCTLTMPVSVCPILYLTKMQGILMKPNQKNISHLDIANSRPISKAETKSNLNKLVGSNGQADKQTIATKLGLEQQSAHETISKLMESDGSEDPGSELDTEFSHH